MEPTPILTRRFWEAIEPIHALPRRLRHLHQHRDLLRPAAVLADLVASGRLRIQSVTTELSEWDDAASAWLAPATKPVLVRN